MSYKVAPGKYQVWIGDICLTFKTERDAYRFANAASYAINNSAQVDGEGSK